MELSLLFSVVISAYLLGTTESTHTGRRYSNPPTWETPSLPEIRHVTEVKTRHVKFHGHVIKGMKTSCGMECQRLKSTQPTSKREMEEELSFETLDMDEMVVTNTNVEVGQFPPELVRSNDSTANSFDVGTADEDKVVKRRKRHVYGLDTRVSLYNRRYMTSYPFSTAVKLSTGCSGILLSPKHVLTSAHCVHDGKRYVKGVRKIKIGKQMTSKSKKARGKGRRGDKKRRRNKKKKNPKKARANPVNRTKRDLTMIPESIAPYFKWVRAKKVHLPQGWLRGADSRRRGELPIEYDYAVIELRRALGNESMNVGICPSYRDIPSGHRIHFTGFDSDRDNEMLYRFCPIEDESADLMYHYCDAQEGTSGSGIYVRLFDRETGQWTRRVIGVFSGHQRVNFPNGSQKEFNTGVRITPLKYAQICYWTKGNYEECRGG